MSLETLLEAAQYLEQQELKQKNGLISTVAGAEPNSNGGSQQHEQQQLVVQHHRSFESRAAAQSLEALSLHTPPAAGTRDALVKSPLPANHSCANDLLALNKARPSLNPDCHTSDLSNHFLNDDSNDGKRRNGPCLLRAGTREVHNKLEKNRRAHLKECFELLKRQLPSQADEKKSSNLSILHSALRYIQLLRRKERDYEHEMEKLAREKIALQQKLSSLKKELTATWDHIDFNKLLQNQLDPAVPLAYSDSIHGHNNGGNISDGDDMGGAGVTAYSSTSSLSSAATASSQSGPNIVSIPTAAMSVMQQSTSTPMVIQTSLPEVTSNTNGKTTAVTNTSAIVHPTLHLPLSQVMSAQGFVVSPTIQLVTGAQGLRVLQSAGGERQLTLLQASSPDRPLALVQTGGTAHLDLSSPGVNSNHGLQESGAITTTASLHKLVSGGVTLMSTPTGSSFRTLSKGLTLPNGLSLCSAAVSLASIKKSTNADSPTAGVADLVTAHPPMSGLGPVAPLVVSQGNQLTHIIAGTTQINGKVTPLLKSMSQVPLVNTQYLSTAAFVKPDVVVNNSTATSVTTSSVVSLPPTSS